jgi:6-phosphogluconolactonase
MTTSFVYVGSYTGSRKDGITVCSLDSENGSLKILSTTPAPEASYLVFHPSYHTLYAVNEITEYQGKPGGSVSAFAVDPQNGSLTYLNEQASGGSLPCYLMLDKGGKFLFFANYGNGTLGVLPVEKDGSLGELCNFIQHHGAGPNAERQEHPHAHSITLDPVNRYALACDLGIDKIIVYRLDLDKGKLHHHAQTHIKPGSGPRHLDFHPNGRWIYLINELSSTLNSYEYDGEKGFLREMQSESTLPADYTGQKWSADIHVSPNGKFVYASNRAHDSITLFAINLKNGKMTFVQRISSGGKNPRNFAISPDGSILLAANQDSGNITTFRIDAETGMLTPTGAVTSIPAPVCVRFGAPGN